jgi:hypothetical protein
MANVTPRTFFSGASLVWSRQRVLWLIFAVNFVLAYVATRGPNERIGAILDHSFAADQLVHGFNLGTFASLAMNPESPFDGLASASFLAAILFTIFMIFATGGILATYYSGQRLHASPFFEACGHHFWRFVRLTIYLLIVLIPVFILSGIAYRTYDRINKQAISPMPAVHFFEAAVVVILLLLICIRVWFDMAQVIAVAEDERRMHKALRRAAALLGNNFLSLYWLYLRVSLIAWIVFAAGLHIWMSHLRPESILAPFLLSQFLIIFWQACRLWQRTSECIWYREHQRAIAVATSAYEPPPIISQGPLAAPTVVVR